MNEETQQHPFVGVYNRSNDTMVDITYACTFNNETKKIELPSNLPGGSEVYVREEGNEEWNHLVTTAVELDAPRVKRARPMKGKLLSAAIGAALNLPLRQGVSK